MRPLQKGLGVRGDWKPSDVPLKVPFVVVLVPFMAVIVSAYEARLVEVRVFDLSPSQILQWGTLHEPRV